MICLRWVRGLRDARAGGEGRWIRVRVAYNMKGCTGCGRVNKAQQPCHAYLVALPYSSDSTTPAPSAACVCVRLNIVCLASSMSYIFLESIGFTRNILAFPLCVFLSFSTSMPTVTLSNTAISTSLPPFPADPIVKV
jgi:hypothetical protein